MDWNKWLTRTESIKGGGVLEKRGSMHLRFIDEQGKAFNFSAQPLLGVDDLAFSLRFSNVSQWEGDGTAIDPHTLEAIARRIGDHYADQGFGVELVLERETVVIHSRKPWFARFVRWFWLCAGVMVLAAAIACVIKAIPR